MKQPKDSFLASINVRSSVPVYEQIENHVMFAISSGRIKAGDRLPSVIELAKRLDINFNTVAKSYRDLQVMGLIYTRRGEGCFINKGVEVQCREIVSRRMVQRIHEATQESKAAGIPKSELMAVVNKSMAMDSSPYDNAPAKIMSLATRKRKSR